MIWSFTDLLTLGRCARKFMYRDEWRIQPKKKATALYLGGATHQLLLHRNLALRDGVDPLPAIGREAEIMREEHSQYLFEDELVELDTLIEDAVDLVTRYHHRYIEQDAHHEILHVEEEFRMEVGDATITFTPDKVYRDTRTGSVWVTDYKTTAGQIPSEPPFSDLQASTYTLGVKQVYPETAGFVLDFLRKKRPTEPRLNKTKSKVDGKLWVNDLMRIDTTFEMLRDFIEREAPQLFDHPQHQQRLAELRDEDRFFGRVPVYLGDEAAVAQDLADKTAMARWVSDTGTYPRTFMSGQAAGYLSCEKCAYRTVCQAQLMGGDVERVLAEDYEDRDDSHKDYEEAEE